jgi:hypothetical protein
VRQPRLGSLGDQDIVDLDSGDSPKVLEIPHYLQGLKVRQACGEVWSFTGDSTSQIIGSPDLKGVSTKHDCQLIELIDGGGKEIERVPGTIEGLGPRP